ncbi:MAG: transcriptional antiterminator, Rof [Hydrogenophilales bacterium CG17_big_fil_post_rev_8_21_14_2_50_63_12]|nr:MAG: transcriptional antiterminator, Rof [Hydrogenophilales bacterium CG17_big_fil_post_rev_8_21_14_2_50_63_12]PIX97541.1 MAG: transcriptional antiterminator, Rof [Hydrogenophilales bacterium CG_4_10_14_3_um_filter_63_21]PJB05125.1 MAG: transcriptional antiterminator, Rof [Hydrogenophilales bacterium CG_4_9_14_3_um_filter_63_34]
MPVNYLPIACATHERLELAVLRRQPLQLTWLGEDGHTQFCERILPLDVETRDGAEWLTIKLPAGGSECVRLDHIHKVIER